MASRRRCETRCCETRVLRWSGASSIAEVSVGVHRGLIDLGAWAGHVPELFALADGGDPEARRLVTRQGEEIGLIAGSLLATEVASAARVARSG